MHQGEQVDVTGDEGIDVDDRQREAGPLQQPAERARVGERRDPRRDAARNLAFGDRQALAQFGQRVAAGERRDEQSVGTQGAADLDHRAGEVVDLVQRQQRDDEIGALDRQRQALEVADHNGEVARSGAGGGRREAQRRAAAGAGGERRCGVRAGRAGVDGDCERALDQDKTLRKLVGGATEQEIGAGTAAAAAPGAVEPRGQQGAVEDLRRCGGHRGFIARRAGGRKGAWFASTGGRVSVSMTVNSCFTRAMSLSEVRAEASPRARIRELFASLSRAALDALYPPVCLACRSATGAHGGLCPACWRAMRFIERPFCDRLGTPFEQDLGEGLLSPQAIADPPVFRRARAVARFEDGPARRLVHRLKYSDRADLAKPLGAWMARAGADVLVDSEAIVPVPLHPLRLWKRRFNQAAALAQAIAAESGKPFEPRWLLRVKPTRSQVGLSREQRAANMQGAFRVAAGAPVRGLRIVLVDDVLTSGATANAAARALLRAGAADVDLVVFARVVTGT